MFFLVPFVLALRHGHSFWAAYALACVWLVPGFFPAQMADSAPWIERGLGALVVRPAQFWYNLWYARA